MKKAILILFVGKSDILKNSEDDQEIPQSQTSDKLVAL